MRPALIAVAVFASATACGDTNESSDALNARNTFRREVLTPDRSELDVKLPLIGPLRVIVGTGEDHFEPLVDGAMLRMEYGPQGGYHVWAGASVHNAARGGVSLDFELLDDTGVQFFERVSLRYVEDSSGEWSGIQTFIEDPERIAGRAVSLRVSATDAAHREAEDTRTVQIVRE